MLHCSRWLTELPVCGVAVQCALRASLGNNVISFACDGWPASCGCLTGGDRFVVGCMFVTLADNNWPVGARGETARVVGSSTGTLDILTRTSWWCVSQACCCSTASVYEQQQGDVVVA